MGGIGKLKSVIEHFFVAIRMEPTKNIQYLLVRPFNGQAAIVIFK
jgi:hypothetical protein